MSWNGAVLCQVSHPDREREKIRQIVPEPSTEYWGRERIEQHLLDTYGAKRLAEEAAKSASFGSSYKLGRAGA